MKIRNISKKVIGIAGNVVMPDDEIVVDELAGRTPAVDVLVKQGYLLILDEPKEKKKRAKRSAEAEGNLADTEPDVEVEE